jgi:hypothetical protein
MSCTRQDQLKYIFRPSIEARCAVPRDLSPEIVARCTELIQPTPSKRHHLCSQSEKAYDNDHLLRWCLARGIKWCLARDLPTEPISGIPTDPITSGDTIGAFVKTTLFWLNMVHEFPDSIIFAQSPAARDELHHVVDVLMQAVELLRNIDSREASLILGGTTIPKAKVIDGKRGIVTERGLEWFERWIEGWSARDLATYLEDIVSAARRQIRNFNVDKSPTNILKDLCAGMAFVLLEKFGSRPTLTVDGPFYQLAAKLYEGTTGIGEGDENLERQCRRAFHRADHSLPELIELLSVQKSSRYSLRALGPEKLGPENLLQLSEGQEILGQFFREIKKSGEIRVC